MDIKLDQDQLTQMVTDAIVGSVVGEKLTEEIEKAVKSAFAGDYNKPSVVEAVVHGVVRQAISAEVQRRGDEIKAIVAEKLTSEMLGEMVARIWSKATEYR